MSIALVIASHSAIAMGPDVSRAVHKYVDVGRFGVRVFFVISGYLITRLLLAEYDREGSVRLGRFYGRRLLRIVPPFYAYLATVLLLTLLGVIAQPWAGVVQSALFVTNYSHHVGWYVGHSWSLSVEEQFYMLWPTVVAGLGARSWRVAAAVLMLCPLVRVAEYHIGWTSSGLATRFETTADALAMGCVLATWARPVVARLIASGVPVSLQVLGASALALVASALGSHPHVDFLVAQSIASVAIGMALVLTVHAPRCVVGRLLNWGPLATLGRVSYSLYLWQQLVFGESVAVRAITPEWRPVVRIVAALGLAWLSYVGIEQPIARQRSAVLARLRQWALIAGWRSSVAM